MKRLSNDKVTVHGFNNLPHFISIRAVIELTEVFDRQETNWIISESPSSHSSHVGILSIRDHVTGSNTLVDPINGSLVSLADQTYC